MFVKLSFYFRLKFYIIYILSIKSAIGHKQYNKSKYFFFYYTINILRSAGQHYEWIQAKWEGKDLRQCRRSTGKGKIPQGSQKVKNPKTTKRRNPIKKTSVMQRCYLQLGKLVQLVFLVSVFKLRRHVFLFKLKVPYF